MTIQMVQVLEVLRRLGLVEELEVLDQFFCGGELFEQLLDPLRVELV